MTIGPGDAGRARQLFVRRAVKDGRAVLLLRGAEVGRGCSIEADVYPVTGLGAEPVPIGPYSFPTLDDALTFVEEALLALEYLGCSIHSGAGERPPAGARAGP